MRYLFTRLNLQKGEVISFMNEIGEVFIGKYENEYDPNLGTFYFENYSNGQIELVKIELLQDIRRA